MPISFKPTFLNMECLHEISTVSSMISDQIWNVDKLNIFFVPLLSNLVSKLDLSSFSYDDKWVQTPESKGQSSTKAAYGFLASRYATDHIHPIVWFNLWKIPVFPVQSASVGNFCMVDCLLLSIWLI